MAIGFRTSSHAGRAASTSVLSVPVPAGTASGDVMLMLATTTPAGTGLTASGWTLGANSPNYANLSALFYKVAGVAEPAASVNTTASGHLEVAVYGFTGVDGTTPLDVAAAWAAAVTGGGNITVPAVTTATANAWRVLCAVDNSGAGVTTSSVPSGWTQRAREPATLVAGNVCDSVLAASAGVQAATTLPTFGAGTAIAVQLALRESGAGGGGGGSTFVPQIAIL